MLNQVIGLATLYTHIYALLGLLAVFMILIHKLSYFTRCLSFQWIHKNGQVYHVSQKYKKKFKTMIEHMTVR